MIKKKFNLLIIVTHLGHGGAEKILIKIANYAVKSISKVSILCPLNVDNFYSSNLRILDNKIKYFFASPRIIYPSFLSDFYRILHYLLAPITALIIYLNLYLSKKRHIISLNLTYGSILLIFFGIYKKFFPSTKIKLIYIFHSNIILLKPFSKILAKFSWNFSDNFIYEIDKTEFSSISKIVDPSKISFIPFGYDIDKSIKNLEFKNNDPLRILWVSRIRYFEKKIDLLLGALEILKLHYKLEFVIDICGNGEDFSRLSKDVESFGLSKEIKLHGYIDDMNYFISKNHLMICTTVNGNAGIAGNQAMAAGLPIVGIETKAEKNYSPIKVGKTSEQIANIVFSLTKKENYNAYKSFLENEMKNQSRNSKLLAIRHLNLYQEIFN